MDHARPLAVSPPVPPRTDADIDEFSRQMRQQHRTVMVKVPILIGDAMLIKRSTLDRVGVFDPRFFGFLADVDYGVRVQRAGLMVVVARGAWLHHEGSGAGKEAAASGGKSVLDNEHEMVRQALAAYELFRDKWGPTLLDQWRDVQPSHLKHLTTLPPPASGDFQHPLDLPPDIADIE